MAKMPFIQENSNGIILKVFVQPRSSKNTITGMYGDFLKIKLTASPVDGAANAMCIKYLAKSLNIPRSDMRIISGKSNRKKVIFIEYQNNYLSTKERERVKNDIESNLLKDKLSKS